MSQNSSALTLIFILGIFHDKNSSPNKKRIHPRCRLYRPTPVETVCSGGVMVVLVMVVVVVVVLVVV